MPAIPTEYYCFLIFINLLKKAIGGIGFRFVPLDSPMLAVSWTLIKFVPGA
jgi:hypothetical protein